ncbi:MAG: hypothetical protein KGD57_02410 [Candidatus Lokiarchaeota archaeon]|nr:hypothetical protein [Candidatus Lokiarchaeota archaeon]
MEQFLFILGRNWKLSLAELDICLKSELFKGKIVDYSANIAVVEFDTLHKDKFYVDKLETLQYYLGGIQKIANNFNFISFHTLNKAFPLKAIKYKEIKKERQKIEDILDKSLDNIFPNIKKENLFFAVSIYPNLFDDIYYKEILVKHFLPFLNKTISKILKEKGANKVLYFKYPQKMIDSGNLNPIFPHHVIKYQLLKPNRAEIILGITEEGIYFGRTYTTDEPNFKKKIDEERPNKEFKSAISPKLSIMMLNFLNLFENRESKRILDPFVGNGTIALFSVIEDFQIYGSDINKKKVSNTIQNIKWLQNELNIPQITNINQRFKVVDIKNLSMKFQEEFFDGIVTEPELGPFFTEKPYYTDGIELVETKLQPLYETTFREANKVLKSKSRICIIAPIISILDDSHDMRLNIEKMAINNNFRPIPLITAKRIINKSNQILQFNKSKIFSIMDAKRDQIVKRKLYVYEKI